MYEQRNKVSLYTFFLLLLVDCWMFGVYVTVLIVGFLLIFLCILYFTSVFVAHMFFEERKENKGLSQIISIALSLRGSVDSFIYECTSSRFKHYKDDTYANENRRIILHMYCEICIIERLKKKQQKNSPEILFLFINFYRYTYFPQFNELWCLCIHNHNIHFFSCFLFHIYAIYNTELNVKYRIRVFVYGFFSFL